LFSLSFNLVAVEEAVRLRERLKDAVKSIKVVTIGPPKCSETLRTALAMGADSAVHVELPESAPAPEPLGVAKALRALIEREKLAAGGAGAVDVVILGKQAIDDDAGQTGQMLAGLLGWAQATFASKVEVDVAANAVNVTREIDGGSEEVRCRLPVVITTDLRCVFFLHLSFPFLMESSTGGALYRLNGTSSSVLHITSSPSPLNTA
jgi:electron transfer flavoprotein beta subunit